jgi:flagellar motor switch protein FliG
MAKRVSAMLSQRLSAIGEQGKRTYSGFQSVAAIMNLVDSSVAQEVLERVESEEPTLAGRIRELMFTFNDLVHVPEAQIRELAGEVDKRVLSTALKGTSEEMRDVFFRTMTTRAIELLKEDIDSLGPVRAKEVTRAQNEIVSIARKLEAEGRMVLKGDSSDEYVV